MKKLLSIISAIIILFAGCSKDEFKGPSLPNTVHFKLNGKYIQCDSGITMICFQNTFSLWAKDSSQTAYLRLNLDAEKNTKLGVGTYVFSEYKSYYGGLLYYDPNNSSERNWKIYTAGQYDYEEGDFIPNSTGKIIFTQYYAGDYAEGTFEFALKDGVPYPFTSDFPFSITEGYFRVRQ